MLAPDFHTTDVAVLVNVGVLVRVVVAVLVHVVVLVVMDVALATAMDVAMEMAMGQGCDLGLWLWQWFGGHIDGAPPMHEDLSCSVPGQSSKRASRSICTSPHAKGICL